MNAIFKDALFKECWMCKGARHIEHDCGDYKCRCINHENDIICPICDGEGGWYLDDPTSIDKEMIGTKDGHLATFDEIGTFPKDGHKRKPIDRL